MSLDIFLKTRNGKEISVSQLYDVLIRAYPNSQIDEFHEHSLLEVFHSDEHLADIVIFDADSALIKWNPESTAILSSVSINGRNQIQEVAETILKQLEFKDVTEGDEEEEDDLSIEEMDAIVEEIEREREMFNESASAKETVLGLFEPKDLIWTCLSIACAPACAAHIHGPNITKKDLQRIVEAFKIEQRLHDQIFLSIQKETKSFNPRVKVLGASLIELSLHGELDAEHRTDQLTFGYRIAVKKGNHQGRWKGTVDIRGEKLDFCDVAWEPFCDDFWD